VPATPPPSKHTECYTLSQCVSVPTPKHTECYTLSLCVSIPTPKHTDSYTLLGVLLNWIPFFYNSILSDLGVTWLISIGWMMVRMIIKLQGALTGYLSNW
jgi:hypothetical protein